MKKQLRLKSSDDIKRIKDAGRIIGEIFKVIKSIYLPGRSTMELDDFIGEIIYKSKARPSFKTLKNYNYSTCISINNEIVHGIPSKNKVIKKGDLVKIDIGIVKGGYFADGCHTFAVNPCSDSAHRLASVAGQALYMGIENMYPGRRFGDMGAAVQENVEASGFSIVRCFTGHGVGFAVHELPSVPHFGTRGKGRMILEGMVLALEPAVNEGSGEAVFLEDGWTAVTGDGKLSAQFEHTVAVTKDGPVILTE